MLTISTSHLLFPRSAGPCKVPADFLLCSASVHTVRSSFMCLSTLCTHACPAVHNLGAQSAPQDWERMPTQALTAEAQGFLQHMRTVCARLPSTSHLFSLTLLISANTAPPSPRATFWEIFVLPLIASCHMASGTLLHPSLWGPHNLWNVLPHFPPHPWLTLLAYLPPHARAGPCAEMRLPLAAYSHHLAHQCKSAHRSKGAQQCMSVRCINMG